MRSFFIPQALQLKRSKNREKIFERYYQPEEQALKESIKQGCIARSHRVKAACLTEKLVKIVREKKGKFIDFEALFSSFSLSTDEGLVLMSLAEALLRIPDEITASALVYDKLKDKKWRRKMGVSQSRFVDLVSMALNFTGRTIDMTRQDLGGDMSVWKSIGYKMVSPILRRAVFQSMRKMGDYFVMAPSLDRALQRALNLKKGGRHVSCDMLGEAAVTDEDVRQYEKAYHNAIHSMANAQGDFTNLEFTQKQGVSVKLSALHAKYSLKNYDAVMDELLPRIKRLAFEAKKFDLMFTLDAEEADRLDLMLDIFEALYRDPDLGEWDGLGLAIQAYQKRAMSVLTWLADIQVEVGRKINVRLVKGAYWDTEIKRAQEKGTSDFPVFTRKYHTDVNYGCCARFMLENRDKFTCSFATHNPLTVAWVIQMAGNDVKGIEFQHLYGMGEALYEALYALPEKVAIPCRVYAPIGPYKELLPYLVRRLLENGANATIVNRLREKNVPLEEFTEDPFDFIETTQAHPHPKVLLPTDIYGEKRKNAKGFDTSDIIKLREYVSYTEQGGNDPIEVKPSGALPSQSMNLPVETLKKPWLRPSTFSNVYVADSKVLKECIERAEKAFQSWSRLSPEERGDIFKKAADLIEDEFYEFIFLCQCEGGKILDDAIAEVREAIDFCRYYGLQTQHKLVDSVLPGSAGEANCLSFKGRGVFACISPWNFPLAVFLGQIVGALCAGNTVICKPARQTPAIAKKAVELLKKAGVPEDVIQFVPSNAEDIQEVVLKDLRVKGVVFTGSTGVAKKINQTLANRPGEIVPFIAETGGLNAMIVDSSALFEQVVHDVIISGFQSAGQRCSALRLLYVQEDIIVPLVNMLEGALVHVNVGCPLSLETDVGPVIDALSLKNLDSYCASRKKEGFKVTSCEVKSGLTRTHCSPSFIELKNSQDLTKEVFGPIVHIISYGVNELNAVVKAINDTGYGLTLGIHSRLQERIDYIINHVHVGNIYVNRNIIGAVVGSQPFGGQGMSGTGPKAGGPHYVGRMAVEQSLSVNTMAVGGNATLMAEDLRK